MKRLIPGLILVLMLCGCTCAYATETAPEQAQAQIDYITGGIITGRGVDTEGKLDSHGLYFPYTGGEMTLELYLEAQGLEKEGVAVMLFLDGLPQPFRMEGSDQLVYQQMLYPNGGKSSTFPISFTPVTGEAGQTLELCVMYFPSLCSPADPQPLRAWYQEDGVMFCMYRVVMEQTPPEAQLPPVTDRLISWSLEYEDIDLYSWTPGNVAWNVYFNGSYTNGITLHGYTGEDPLSMEYILFGDSQDDYRVVVYIDGEPVFFDGQIPTFHPSTSQKVSLNAMLDCSGLEGDQIVFAVILRRNYYGEGVGWEFYPGETSDIRVIHLTPDK